MIGWGLPPATPAVAASEIRSSYAFDEDDILTPLSFTRPEKLDLDPRQYHWGTLHLYLVLGSLEVAERLAFVHHPWRTSFYNLLPGDFEKVYIAGRLASVLGGLASIAAVFFLTREFASKPQAFWAASLVAASPAHLLGSAQIRVDLTLTALVVLAACLAIRACRSGTPAAHLLLGVAAGASVAAKYTAIFFVVPCFLLVLAACRFAGRRSCALLIGAVGGFILSEPPAVMKPSIVAAQLLSVFQMSRAIPEAFRIPVADLLKTDALHAIRFLAGAPGALLAVIGVALMLRRMKVENRIVLAMLGGGTLSLIPLLWPMLRYELPLLPFLTVAAAVALERMPRFWRHAAAVIALVFPLAATFDQIRFMRAPHPANLILPIILKRVPPGTPIARLVPELPPLDRKLYPMGLNPLLDNLEINPPAWVLLTNLPVQSYPVTTTGLLVQQYTLVAQAEHHPLFPWATLGRSGAPYDWKYTNPSLALYQKRASP